MDTYIARQPIFNRQMRVHGYELLHRQGNQNQFMGIDDRRATEELIYNSFLVMDLETLTDNTLAFINFPKALIEKKLPGILPSKSVIIEVLERGKATQDTIDACRELRKNGYTIALDDFTLDEDNMPLLEVADIVKVDYPSVSLDAQRRFIKQYRRKVKLLAEKIETRQDFAQAMDMGYDLFQGYFFKKPIIIQAKEVNALPANVCFLIKELSRAEPSYSHISAIIERDLSLSYKLLKMVNTVYFGSKQRVTSISRALLHIGLNELRQWVPILMLKDLRKPDNAEAIKLSIIRGKMMDLVAEELGEHRNASEYFLTGLFSFMDILMYQPMEQILNGLPLSGEVKQALMGQPNKYKRCLDYVTCCETASWDGEKFDDATLLDSKKFMTLYFEALEWTKQLNY
jgi:c-di-GMP-related signal transduction protein